ncbi:hypothetical protein F444_05663 [Phytophthora nicotianae P1976]|uniref:Uncharacterized protein n=1 Tax=Phytophthora nicotianae P1976 TaxID=1317066 RepID=A0A081ALC4_PHYNI|nr:hypothetical protein F444_05663 [Phytophthora nicotianae P1976]
MVASSVSDPCMNCKSAPSGRKPLLLRHPQPGRGIVEWLLRRACRRTGDRRGWFKYVEKPSWVERVLLLRGGGYSLAETGQNSVILGCLKGGGSPREEHRPPGDRPTDQYTMRLPVEKALVSFPLVVGRGSLLRSVRAKRVGAA